MGCASGNKLPGLSWKNQASALKAPFNQIGNALCPFLYRTIFAPCKVGPPGVAQKKFPSHLCLRESEALQITCLKPFLRLLHTVRDSVPLALCAIISKLHGTCVQSSRRPNQTYCSFLMSSRIIQSLCPLLVLKNADIDTDIFKAHSVHGGSTTAAVNSNVPLDDVILYFFKSIFI